MATNKLSKAYPEFPKGFVVVEGSFLNRLCNDVALLMSMKGIAPISIAYNQDGIVIRDQGILPFFPAEITSKTQISTYNQYTYGFAEVDKLTAGYGTVSGGVWGIRYNGRSGTAYNMCENGNNISSGQLDNGITIANIPAGFAFQPVKVGDIVMIIQKIVISTGANEYWISAGGFQNAIDGHC
jgi:hypothetical protein